MRPGSIDEVLAAYQSAIRDRQCIDDRLVIAADRIARLQKERDEKTKLIRELREEVRAYSDAVAA